MDMKKYLIVVIIASSFSMQNLFANPLESAFDKVSYIIFKAAWPTATYKDYEIFEVNQDDLFVIVKMNGISSFSDGKLVIRLKVLFTENYGIKDVKIIKHNAILSPPFNTLGALSTIIANSSNSSSSSRSKPNYAYSSNNNRPSKKYFIHVKNKCNKTIKVAIDYKAVSGTWKTEYWYKFTPYESGYLTDSGVRLSTRNSILYYYAVSDDKTSVWNGNEVTKYISGEKIEMGKLVDKQGDNNLIFTCGN